MREEIHPVEDAFHRIQSPAPAMAALKNSNDQVHDAICVALWNAGVRNHEAQVAVSDLKVVLSGGKLPGALHRKCLSIARRLGGGRVVADETIAPHGGPTSSPGIDPAARIDGRPAVFVARYCGLDSASIHAGIASAVRALERFLPPDTAGERNDSVLIFRNLRGDTVTIEVGYVVREDVAAAAHDEVRGGRTPAGPALAQEASNGGHALAKDFAALRAKAIEHGMSEPAYFWQQLPNPRDPWPADQPTRLFAAWK